MEGSGEFLRSRKASSVESIPTASFIFLAQRAFHLASPGDRGTSPSLKELLARGHGMGTCLQYKAHVNQPVDCLSITAYLFTMYSPRDMGWSVAEGEGVAERLGGRASVDEEPPLLEVAERLNLKGSLVPIRIHQMEGVIYLLFV